MQNEEWGKSPSRAKDTSTYMVLEHCTTRLASCVILSNAKNLSERPFAALRVTLSLCNLTWPDLRDFAFSIFNSSFFT